MSSSSCCIKTDAFAAGGRQLKCWLAGAVMLAAGCLAALAVAAAPAQAAEAAGWRDDVPHAHQVGSGELSMFGFRIYRISLWSAATPFDPAQAFALELTYARSISRERLVQVSLDEMRRLSGPQLGEERLRQWEALMQNAFIDVRKGDQLIGVYLPGTGCRFYSRSGLLAEVRDPAFAQAFFAIWLDPRSKDVQLRQHLLGEP